jgi:hypothetical protein
MMHRDDTADTFRVNATPPPSLAWQRKDGAKSLDIF